MNDYTYQVLSSYNLMKSKMREQLHEFNIDVIDQTDTVQLAENQLQINITNAMNKLEKYRQLLTSPVYYVLRPDLRCLGY